MRAPGRDAVTEEEELAEIEVGKPLIAMRGHDTKVLLSETRAGERLPDSTSAPKRSRSSLQKICTAAILVTALWKRKL